MENKGLIAIIALSIIFGILIFTTPFIESEYASSIWVLLFGAILAIVIIMAVGKLLKAPRQNIIENFKKEHALIKIFSIAFVISFICNVITFQYFDITMIILGILAFLEIFLELGKKED